MKARNCILGTINRNALRFGQGCEGPYYVVAPDGYSASCSTLENAATFIVAMGWTHEQPVDVRDRLTEDELQNARIVQILRITGSAWLRRAPG